MLYNSDVDVADPQPDACQFRLESLPAILLLPLLVVKSRLALLLLQIQRRNTTFYLRLFFAVAHILHRVKSSR
jgi:hypothetical protein